MAPRRSAKPASTVSADTAKQPAEAPTHKARRRRLPADERRREIIEAAQRVFIRDGLDGARTRDIAAEAKINPATMFHYFESKEALFEAAIIEPWKEFIQDETVSASRFAAANTEGKRSTAISATRHELEIMDRMFPLLAAALFNNRERGKEFYFKHFRPFVDEQARMVQVGTPDWKERGLDPELIALQTIATGFFYSVDRYYRGTKLNTLRAAEKMMDLQLFGILGDRSRAGS